MQSSDEKHSCRELESEASLTLKVLFLTPHSLALNHCDKQKTANLNFPLSNQATTLKLLMNATPSGWLQINMFSQSNCFLDLILIGVKGGLWNSAAFISHRLVVLYWVWLGC